MGEPAAWFYLDEARTHAIRVRLEREPRLRLVVRESAFSREDPDEEAYLEAHLLAERWEARLHVLALERRLTLLGRYHKLAAGGAAWERVASGAATEKLDLEPLERRKGADAGAVEFHHYTSAASSHAVTLVGVPQRTSRGPRWVLARLDFTFPDVEGGRLQLVHERLPPAVYRSALASLHLELLDGGFERTRKRGSVSADARWWAALQAVLDATLARVTEQRVGKGAPASHAAAAAHARRAKAGAFSVAPPGSDQPAYQIEPEVDGPATAVRAQRGRKDLDQLDATLLNLLRDPKLAALHERYLPDGGTAHLLDRGELAILDGIKRLKEARPPDEWHLLSILQASLLVRYAMAKRGRRMDPEARELLKHAPAWL